MDLSTLVTLSETDAVALCTNNNYTTIVIKDEQAPFVSLPAVGENRVKLFTRNGIVYKATLG